tara:strand:+ start:110 stop:325 length:216 start_codon:yes stop_codon:yes gene_type:complete
LTFAERVKEQEKQMPTKKYMIKEERHYRRPLVARLVEYALCAYLFCAAVGGTVVGGLWAFGYLEMWMPPQL